MAHLLQARPGLQRQPVEIVPAGAGEIEETPIGQHERPGEIIIERELADLGRRLAAQARGGEDVRHQRLMLQLRDGGGEAEGPRGRRQGAGQDKPPCPGLVARQGRGGI